MSRRCSASAPTAFLVVLTLSGEVRAKTILALTGVSLDSGEMVVVTPQGDGRFTVIGRFAAHGP